MRRQDNFKFLRKCVMEFYMAGQWGPLVDQDLCELHISKKQCCNATTALTCCIITTWAMLPPLHLVGTFGIVLCHQISSNNILSFGMPTWQKMFGISGGMSSNSVGWTTPDDTTCHASMTSAATLADLLNIKKSIKNHAVMMQSGTRKLHKGYCTWIYI